MRFLPLSLALLAPIGLVAFNSPEPPAKTVSEAEAFAVDPVHSNVLFKVKHNNASWFYGRFGEISGEFVYDAEEPANSEVMVEVNAESVDTRNDKLNQHLRSPDFLDARQFPVISFISSKVEQRGENLFAVTGELTLHGVTKELTVEMELVGTSEGRGGKIMGFHTSFTINRKEYGVNYGTPDMVGDEVELILAIEAGVK